jgi:EAL domain-containing protein (putative c-di-GMP-specific phosphodiesterase class I)
LAVSANRSRRSLIQWVFQPVFDFASASFVGYEGQVAWRRSRGMLAETANAAEGAGNIKTEPGFRLDAEIAEIL